MFPDKIKITDDLIKLIIDTRKEYNLTAYQLSEKIGKNKSWLPNIENKRTKNISREDLIILFKNFAKDKGIDPEEFVIKYLSPTATVELDNNITVPNHYLQSSMEIFSPDHEDLHISFEERMNRMRYTMEEKPYEVDLMKLKKKLNDLSDLIIDEFSYCKSSDDRQSIIKMVDMMNTNLVGKVEFAYIQKLYQIPIFYGESNIEYGDIVGAEYIKNTLSNIDSFSATQRLFMTYASVYSEITPQKDRYNLLAKIQSITNKVDKDILDSVVFSLDGFIYNFQEYIKAVYNEAKINNHPCSNDFTPIFEYIIKCLKLFIQNADLEYHFNYEIPNDTNDFDAILKKCLELNNISYGIKQAIHYKYK